MFIQCTHGREVLSRCPDCPNGIASSKPEARAPEEPKVDAPAPEEQAGQIELPPGLYPEIEKVLKMQPVAQVMGDFLVFLQTSGMVIARKIHDERHGKSRPKLRAIDLDIETMLYHFFKIDKKKVQEERGLLRAAQAEKGHEVPDAEAP